MSSVTAISRASDSENWRSYNNIFEIKSLPFDLLVMRHGPAVPNDKQQIVSDLPNGQQKEYGLTVGGREVVQLAVRKAKEEKLLKTSKPLIISSPFARCLDTAVEAGNILEIDSKDIQIDIRLRERFFGKFNLGSTESYSTVWEWDISEPRGEFLSANRVESVYEVLDRVTEVVSDLHRAFTMGTVYAAQVLLVMHADPAQILDTGIRKVDPRTHNLNMQRLQPGEIRRLKM